MGAFRLASLTLEGFKSFASRVDLSFPGAITAIVGPNGAGKSNICDAIAWVLGEQSARLLRSQTMADVIFNGSPKRGQAGSALVTLSLSAGDGRWAGTDGRLEIARRVLRDGTSDYRVGGRRVRLKDVVDQMMDAGLGTRSYAIIEQGRIGQVLSVRATERRVLFEEAAGITKFRARRHEAELKLAETRANLLRLADVAAEVKHALDQARRQARRAEKHLELRRALAELRALLFAARRVALQAAVDARREALVEVTAREAEAASAMAQADAALELLRRDLDAAQERLAVARGDEARADAAAQRREAEEVAARRELDEAGARREAAAVEAQRLAGSAATLHERDAELVAAVEGARATHARDEARAADEALAATAAEESARAAAAQAEEARRALLAGVAAATEAQNRVHRFGVEAEQVRYQRQRLTAEHERLAAHLTQAAGNEEQAAATVGSVNARLAEIDANRAEVRTRHDALLARAAELQADRDRTGHERWQAHHEHEGLQRAVASARALPQALARALPEDKVLGTVGDFLQPDDASARRLDQAYGDLLTLPVVADEPALAELVTRLPRIEGRLAVAVARRGLPARPSELLERAGADPDDLGWLAAALPRAAVAASHEAACALADADPDLVIVLPDGGRRRGRRVELPGTRSAAAGVLELRGRERAAAARERESAAREDELAEALDATRAEIAELAAGLATADTEARRAGEELAAATSTREALHRERARLQRELEALTAEAARLDGEAAALVVRLAEGTAEAERLAVRAAQLESEVDRRSRTADAAQQAAAASRAGAERARGVAAVARERLIATERELERHRVEIASLAEREAAARAEEAAQRARVEASTKAAATARADLEELLANRTAAHREAESLTEVEASLKERVTASAHLTEAARAAHLAARDAAHGERLALSEASGALDRLHETIALLLAGQAELPEAPPPVDELPALESREKQLAAELEALGPVNELAVAEKDELETRHAFLAEQRKDLERSLDTLKDTVTELDATCAERFLKTIEEANVAFDRVFRELFGGGEARIELSDPEAPLESGLEIRVRPPGKHTQSVLLLSGGEKALAAIALLVALFSIRPAPFCVLDEVDAPLDDANVERLCRLLRQMSDETQFLLITHNRRTMAHADVLYGVTMEEPGVSRIVSVRMEE
jgi:chromosome segregation protein